MFYLVKSDCRLMETVRRALAYQARQNSQHYLGVQRLIKGISQDHLSYVFPIASSVCPALPLGTST
ncbi:MAG: hypothetical protein CM1200mP36_11360 [Gammaproteobacteria bacterium]|nr:MAG: hypothetical protein CM1200mP36_11360 [Gammaproteobacteria bacterium]